MRWYGLLALTLVLLPAPEAARAASVQQPVVVSAPADGFEYAVIDRATEYGSVFALTSLSWRELEPLLEGKDEGPVFWFRLDGRAWIVRDEASIAEARTILEPVRALKQVAKAAKKDKKSGAGRSSLPPDFEERRAAVSGKAAAELLALARRTLADGRAQPYTI